jgi:Tol biopolymer transport system component
MEVWMAALDGSQARQISHDGVDAENPTMTADGEWIIYASSNDEKYGIWKIRPDGTDAERIAEGPFLIPEVSPDGRYVAFMSVRSLDFAIHVLDLESGEVLPYEIDVIANTRSRNLVLGRTRWSADGTALIFIGQDATGRTGILRQAFHPEQIQSGDPIELAGFDNSFTTESLGISPDGRWLVISAQHDQRVLKIVQNVDLTSWR